MQGFVQDFFPWGGGGGGGFGGNVHVVAAIVSVCVNTPCLGGSGGIHTLSNPHPDIFSYYCLQSSM